MVLFACLMSHSSIRHKLGNMATRSKTCRTGIIYMTILSGLLSVWSPLKLSCGTCPSSPPFCVSASSSFSWWSFISSTASLACFAACVRSNRSVKRDASTRALQNTVVPVFPGLRTQSCYQHSN